MSEETKKLDLSGDGGVLKEILKEGTGADTPNNGCKVSLHYTGRLVDGTEFDSSVARNEPFEFELGKGHVIKAFDMGVATMKVGERCFLTCASNYAYGAAGSPPSIPPDATLIFELEMLGWKGEDLSPNQDGSIERTILEQSDKKRSPSDGAFVKAHISGTFDGKVFEERDVEFDYGEGSANGIVEGLELALEKMNIGETSKIKIQSKYAFGNKGSESFKIPPNSTIEYTVKLLDCGKGLEEWKLSDDERVAEAKVYKEKGTNYFKKENYELAIKMYTKCKNLLPSLKDNTSDEVKTLKVATHSNIALSHQKSNNHFEAKQECNAVLELDANNVKALYRRGQCNLVINELEEALDDFQKVIELEPTNKAAANHIVICKQKIKQNKDKEKKLYANMFAKLAANDKETDPPRETDVLDQCGEWSEEDAKREADLTLERDNIIMI
ncbi:FK506-binding protein 59 [Drosophila sulfurigaster albostrigata]|uniref:FK506-binding protein 59 n=1 Tax=Drosophila sulfurigaster albostrigata TaxID=89887 RepID=UPI002D21BE48|nr:FK506-binding protein 59 [Drosophila sulfurigaster albostrigata]